MTCSFYSVCCYFVYSGIFDVISVITVKSKTLICGSAISKFEIGAKLEIGDEKKLFLLHIGIFKREKISKENFYKFLIE